MMAFMVGRPVNHAPRSWNPTFFRNAHSVSVDPSESSFIAGVVEANNTENKNWDLSHT